VNTRLAFHVATGLAGRFVTVRPGSDLSRIEPHSKVELRSATREVLGIAIARDCWCGDLALIPASVLEMEQNPLHRTYSGLIMGLRAVSKDGDPPLAPDSKVTALVLDFVGRNVKEIITP
jgi:hypothetical protein